MIAYAQEEIDSFKREYDILAARALKADGTPKKRATPDDLKRIAKLVVIADKLHTQVLLKNRKAKQAKAKQYSEEWSKKFDLTIGQEVILDVMGSSEPGTYLGAISFGPDGEPTLQVRVGGGVYLCNPDMIL